MGEQPQKVQEGLEEVRELLMGSQMRGLEKRLAKFESTVQQDLARLQDEFTERFRSLEEFAKKEFSEVWDKFESAMRDRGEAHDSLAQEARTGIEAAKSSIRRIEEAGSQARRKLSEQLVETGEKLRREFRDRQQELGREIRSEAHELQIQKASRTDLAALFNDLATQINGNVGAAKEGKAKA